MYAETFSHYSINVTGACCDHQTARHFRELGGLVVKDLISSVDFNTFPKNSIRFSWNGDDYQSFHAPFYGSMAVFTVWWSNDYKMQLAILLGSKGVASRFTTEGDNAWRNWIKHVE